ncbi:MAG TPA: VOC family protein [Jatrophihabitans sp.]|nr:VOC family protein [Jatrophihabitans sp.]
MPIAELLAVNLDCANPPELAEFYSKLTGGEVAYSTDEYAGVQIAGGPALYFQKVADHRPPTWPDAERPQQSHLDFYVDNLPDAEAAALEFGASRPDFQPNADKCVVLLDPAGHPLCLCVRS